MTYHSDSEPPAPPQHNQDSSLYFENPPDKIHITPGSIPKQSIDEPDYKDEFIMMDGVVTGGGPDDYYEEEKRNSLPNMEEPVILNEGEPIPMSGKPLEVPDVCSNIPLHSHIQTRMIWSYTETV